MLIVAEILGHGQRRVADAEAGTGRLVHLAEHHHHVGQHARRLHVAVELLAFAATLADAAENAHAFVLTDHVFDHLGEGFTEKSNRAFTEMIKNNRFYLSLCGNHDKRCFAPS